MTVVSRALLRPVVFVPVVVLVGASVLAVWTPWVLVGTDLLLIAWLLSARSSWAFGFASGIIVLAALAAVLARVTPLLHLPLVVSEIAVLDLVGLAALLLGFTDERRRPAPQVAWLLSVTTIPAVILIVAVADGVTNRLGYSWAMQNDAVWNSVTARLVITDGGVLGVHPNPSPLTTILMALAAAPGRFAVGGAGLLQHDIAGFAQLWLVMAAGTTILAGLIVIGVTHTTSVVLRVVAGSLGGAIVLTWYAVGLAFDLGFYNATVTLLILLAMWRCWLESDRHPYLSALAVSGALVGSLATWAPIAVLPGGLLVLALVRWWRSTTARGFRRTGLGLLLVIVPVGYAAAATLPDLLNQGAALASDGGIFPFTPRQALVSVAVCVAVVVFHQVRGRKTPTGIGFAVLIPGSVLGIAILLAQRIHQPTLWGYYPVKMTWLILDFLLVLLVAEIFAMAAESTGRWIRLGLVLLSGALLTAGVMSQLAPLSTRLPLVGILAGGGSSPNDVAARDLFAVANPEARILAADYRGNATDRFIDAWTLQLNSEFGSDPIRRYSYYLTPSDPKSVCAAISAWKFRVTVITSSTSFADRLDAVCAGRDYEVSLRG